MKREIIMPKIGLDMEEGTIVSWLKKVGDQIETGEIIAQIETDKAVTDIEAAFAGTIVEIVAEEGDTVEITKTIAWVEADE